MVLVVNEGSKNVTADSEDGGARLEGWFTRPRHGAQHGGKALRRFLITEGSGIKIKGRHAHRKELGGSNTLRYLRHIKGANEGPIEQGAKS